MRPNRKSFLYEGTEVVTEDLRIGHVIKVHSNNSIDVRFSTAPWPFGELASYKRCQLNEIPIEYDDAPF